MSDLNELERKLAAARSRLPKTQGAERRRTETLIADLERAVLDAKRRGGQLPPDPAKPLETGSAEVGSYG